MPFQYPQTSFHFKVDFQLSPQIQADTRFLEVSGLNASIALEPAYQGQEGGTAVEIPAKVNYENLVLRRGIIVDSAIREWCINAIEKFEFQPTNLTVMLLDPNHEPMMSWYVVAAYPIAWKISAFNAEKSEIAIESITLRYNHFRTLSLQ